MADQTLTTESIVLFRNSQGIESRGSLVRLTRNIAVFEVYNPHSIVQLSEVLTNIRIRRGDRTTYTGRAVVSNLVSTGLLLLVSVTLVDPWSDLVDLAPGAELRQEVVDFVNDWETTNQTIQSDYALSVGRLRNFLQELSRWLEHGDTVAGIGDGEVSEAYARKFVMDVFQAAAPKLRDLFQAFEHTARGIAEDALVSHKAFARRELHPLMLCSPFIHRTYTKPLGYAGDYEMVKMILDDPWRGANTYAKLINAAFLQSDVAEAHRNRIELLKTALAQEAQRATTPGRPFRVLNVGCGPAAEVFHFLKHDPHAGQSEFHLLDFSQETLDYVKAGIERTMDAPAHVRYIHRSIHDLLKEAAGRKPGDPQQYDMVYCAGLFDYLSDRICKRLLRLFHEWTIAGGLVVVTNVHPRNPIRAIMEHIVEWYLVMRDEQDILDMAPTPSQPRVLADKTGTNVLLEVRKTPTPVTGATGP